MIIRKAFPLGIDIGTNSIKVIQLAPTSQGLQMIKLMVEELPLKAIDNPEERKHLLPKVLKSIIKKEGLKGNDVFSSLSSLVAQIKIIKLPPMPENEIEGAISWKVQQTTRVNLKNLSFDYFILGAEEISQAKEIKILTVIVSKEKILEHLALLQSAGLNPLGVEVDILSLISRIDFISGFRTGETVLLLEFGAGVTVLNVVVNKELYFTRNLAITGNSLTRAIRDYCNVSFQEAEQLKKAYGLTASDQKALEVKLALLPLLEHLVSDIKISRKYYQITQSRVTNYDRIILSGGSSRLKGFLPFLNSYFNVETTNPLGKIKINPQAKIDDLEEMTPRLSVALGLALRGMK